MLKVNYFLFLLSLLLFITADDFGPQNFSGLGKNLGIFFLNSFFSSKSSLKSKSKFEFLLVQACLKPKIISFGALVLKTDGFKKEFTAMYPFFFNAELIKKQKF